MSEDTSGLDLDGVQGFTRSPAIRVRSDGGDWKPSREDWVEVQRSRPYEHQEGPSSNSTASWKEQHRHFGYRVANEIARFVNLAREQAKDTDAAVDAAFDLALLQKVLPKFHGTQQELQSLLEEIFQFAVRGGDHIPKRDQKVELDDWSVVKGRLVARSKTQSPSGDPGTDGDEADSNAADAADADAATQPPAYPRTAAKILRMLQRLRDRGFTSFIE